MCGIKGSGGWEAGPFNHCVSLLGGQHSRLPGCPPSPPSIQIGLPSGSVYDQVAVFPLRTHTPPLGLKCLAPQGPTLGAVKKAQVTIGFITKLETPAAQYVAGIGVPKPGSITDPCATGPVLGLSDAGRHDFVYRRNHIIAYPSMKVLQRFVVDFIGRLRKVRLNLPPIYLHFGQNRPSRAGWWPSSQIG